MAPDIVLGIVTVIMALLGAAVSLHPPESLHAPGKWGVKVCYAMAFAVLGTIAIICVIKQSKETAIANQGLTNALGNLGDSTREIARVTTLNTALQEKLLGESAKISKLAEESFRNITGADSFPYVVPQPAAYPGPVKLFVWDHGKYMLTGVTLAIRHANDFSFYQAPLDIGILHPGWGKPLSAMLLPKPDPTTGRDSFMIEMYTQSDFFTEEIDFRKSKDGKYWATRFFVTQSKLGELAEKPLPRRKLPAIPKNGSISFFVLYRDKWSDGSEDK